MGKNLRLPVDLLQDLTDAVSLIHKFDSFFRIITFNGLLELAQIIYKLVDGFWQMIGILLKDRSPHGRGTLGQSCRGSKS